MRRPFRGWANPKYMFRYYVIRKKASLSDLVWSGILDRAHESTGMYNVELATRDWCDAAISLRRGGWGDNHLEIVIYDGEDKPSQMVRVGLSYRSMTKVMRGFDDAMVISRRIIQEENTAKESRE